MWPCHWDPGRRAQFQGIRPSMRAPFVLSLGIAVGVLYIVARALHGRASFQTCLRCQEDMSPLHSLQDLAKIQAVDLFMV